MLITNAPTLNSRKYFIGFIVTVLMFAATNVVSAVSTVDIGGVVVYKKPPSAYALAKKLFPIKTRSIGQKVDAGTNLQATTIAFIINFEFDSVSVTTESRPYLDALGEMLNFKQLKGKTLRIEGHADAKGDSNYNLVLSEGRARAIKNYLTDYHRIDPSRLVTLGYGESRLLIPTDPMASENRRAEFTPVKQTAKKTKIKY